MTLDPARLRLYLVTDRGLASGRSLVDLVIQAVAGGVTMVQIREKHLATRAFIEETRALKAALAGSGVPLIVNDRVDVALAVGADGVHLGDEDMTPVEARRLLGENAIIGLSVFDRPDPPCSCADYLAASPVFATPTKPDAGPGLGLDGLRRLRAGLSGPLVAIGGIDARNARAVIDAGADGIAVVSAILGSKNPKTAAAKLLKAMNTLS